MVKTNILSKQFRYKKIWKIIYFCVKQIVWICNKVRFKREKIKKTLLKLNSTLIHNTRALGFRFDHQNVKVTSIYIDIKISEFELFTTYFRLTSLLFKSHQRVKFEFFFRFNSWRIIYLVFKLSGIVYQCTKHT